MARQASKFYPRYAKHIQRLRKTATEYHGTRDIFHVMRVLCLIDIKNTLVCIDLEHEIFKTSNVEEYTVKVAHNVEEAHRLAEVGFEKFGEFDGKHHCRKRK
jgi:hypothetical protein